EDEEQRRKMFRSIKAKADSKRTMREKVADRMTSIFGSIIFLLANALFFVVWIIVNTNLIKGISAFDPFPFTLLTTIVSLEAIILAIFVLVSQNRSMKVDDLREEVDLQINLIIEKEVTKVMKMLSLLLEKNGIDL